VNRRDFLSLLGIGAAAAAVLPVEELADRLQLALHPKASVALPPGVSWRVEQTSGGIYTASMTNWDMALKELYRPHLVMQAAYVDRPLFAAVSP
jgi:hypothetical protein